MTPRTALSRAQDIRKVVAQFFRLWALLYYSRQTNVLDRGVESAPKGPVRWCFGSVFFVCSGQIARGCRGLSCSESRYGSRLLVVENVVQRDVTIPRPAAMS